MLASNTDGIAFLNSNDLRGQMRRLAADFTSYYLLGYSSTNAKLDGGFRTIKVRVTRPGVEVRARRGYRAASASELAAAKKIADTPKPAANAALDKELGMLAREGRPAEARPERPAAAPSRASPSSSVAARPPATCSRNGPVANSPAPSGCTSRCCPAKRPAGPARCSIAPARRCPSRSRRGAHRRGNRSTVAHR